MCVFSELALNCSTVLFKVQWRLHLFSCGSYTLECLAAIHKTLVNY